MFGQNGRSFSRPLKIANHCYWRDRRTEPLHRPSPHPLTLTIERRASRSEVGGMFVQALAGLASLCGTVLVYTGIALSLRRFVAWRRRRSRATVAEAPQAA